MITAQSPTCPNDNHQSLHYKLQSHYITTLQITNVGEHVEKRIPKYTVPEIVNWYSHYGKQYEVLYIKM